MLLPQEMISNKFTSKSCCTIHKSVFSILKKQNKTKQNKTKTNKNNKQANLQLQFFHFEFFYKKLHKCCSGETRKKMKGKNHPHTHSCRKKPLSHLSFSSILLFLRDFHQSIHPLSSQTYHFLSDEIQAMLIYSISSLP